MTDLARLRKALNGFRLEDNPAIVQQKSRDFYWYSPILKAQLDHVTADLVVTPTNEEEVRQILKICYAMEVPVTPRGAGTGNYGQAMPLAGGVVLDLSAMSEVREIAPGRVVADGGAVLADIDDQTRAHSGQELRLLPSTFRTATLGGFVAGGSGGIGSVTWGGLRDLGNILRLRIVTMEAEPRVLDLSGWDLHKVMHAYGTNGIITEVEAPLTTAYDWVDFIVGFDSHADAIDFAYTAGNQDGLLFKELATVAAPMPHDYFLRHRKLVRREQSLALVVLAPQSVDPFVALAAREKADLLYRSDTASDDQKKGLPPVYELTWNHTTLRGLRVDPGITYLQVLYPNPGTIEKAKQMDALFGDEVPGHLEFIRFDGELTCVGLPVVRYASDIRLEEIVHTFEVHGCHVFNPHRYTLEEGGMKKTDEVQLAFKREADPRGLLNPGKMIAWDDPDFDLEDGGVYLFPGLQR